jgi:hypothetical protein
MTYTLPREMADKKIKKYKNAIETHNSILVDDNYVYIKNLDITSYHTGEIKIDISGYSVHKENKMEKYKEKEVITKTRYNLTTDDIEKLIKEQLNLKGTIDFRWNISQWVDLDVIVTERRIEE